MWDRCNCCRGCIIEVFKLTILLSIEWHLSMLRLLLQLLLLCIWKTVIILLFKSRTHFNLNTCCCCCWLSEFFRGRRDCRCNLSHVVILNLNSAHWRWVVVVRILMRLLLLLLLLLLLDTVKFWVSGLSSCWSESSNRCISVVALNL